MSVFSIIQGDSKVNIKVSERSKKAAERTVFNIFNSKKISISKAFKQNINSKKTV